MRFCTRLRGEPDPDGRLRDVTIADVSLVDDGHMTGRDIAGDWHIPGAVRPGPGWRMPAVTRKDLP